MAEVSLRDAARPPHPLVAALVAEMPIDHDGETVIGFNATNIDWTNESDRRYGLPAPLAAHYVVTVLRWMARDLGICLTAADAVKVDQLAAEIESTRSSNTEETTTA